MRLGYVPTLTTPLMNFNGGQIATRLQYMLANDLHIAQIKVLAARSVRKGLEGCFKYDIVGYILRMRIRQIDAFH